MSSSNRRSVLAALSTGCLAACIATSAFAGVKDHSVRIRVSDGVRPMAGVTLRASSEQNQVKLQTDALGVASFELAGEWLTLEAAGIDGVVSDTEFMGPGTGVIDGELVLANGIADLLLPNTTAPGTRAIGSRDRFRSLDRESAHRIESGRMQISRDTDEPNDTAETCSAAPAPGVLLETELGTNQDQDWYCIDLSCGDNVVITTHPPTERRAQWVNTVIDFYNPDGSFAASDDDGNGVPYSRLSTQARANGTFFIRISSMRSASSGQYGLTVDSQPGGTPLYVTVTQTPIGSDVLLTANAMTDGPVTYTRTVGTASIMDISGTGTPVTLGDDQGIVVPMGFSMPFYTNTYSSTGIASNGYLSFGANLTNFTNTCLPNPGTPNDTIAAFWDDLNPGAGGSIYYQSMGSAPNRQFIVQFVNVQYFPSGGAANFQTIVNENGTIQFRYGSNTTTGNGATVGLENADGSGADQHSCNAGVITNGLEVTFVRNPPTLIPWPAPQTYTVSTGSNALENIASTGTRFAMGDDTMSSFPIGFNFKYFGTTYATANISSNGNVQLVGSNGSFSNVCIPNTGSPNAMIAPFWDDMHGAHSSGSNPIPAGGRGVRQTLGTAPNRRWIMQWDRVGFFGASNEDMTFQVILYETTNNIEFRYGTLNGGSAGTAAAGGSGATIGIENQAGNSGHSISCNTANSAQTGRSRLFTSSEVAGSYRWVSLQDGMTRSTTNTLLWNASMGCQIELTVTVRDNAANCDKVHTRIIDMCDDGGGGTGIDCPTLADCLAECEANSTNHGSYVSCVAHVTQRLWSEGAITRDERQGTRTGAAQAGIGH